MTQNIINRPQIKEKNIVCINCPKGCRIKVEAEGDHIKNISGYKCKEGKKYAREEFINPTRILPATVKVINGEYPLVPVKTDQPIPKDLLLTAMKVIAGRKVEAPIEVGDILIANILGTGVDLVATSNIDSVD